MAGTASRRGDLAAMTIYERALELVADGDTIGLGTGRAASAFIRALADRVRQGLRVRGVATSRASEELAAGLGIPVVALDAGMPLACTFDGADEVDPHLNLIKGFGRAMVREKVVAAASRRLVILVGTEKIVPALGSRGKLPVEVVPFALAFVRRRMEALGLPAEVVLIDGRPAVSDNGNALVTCAVTALADPAAVERQLRDIPGVVGTGLFLGMAERVLVGDEARAFALVEERPRR